MKMSHLSGNLNFLTHIRYWIFTTRFRNELEFDKSQMASFFMATDNWEKEEEFHFIRHGYRFFHDGSPLFWKILFSERTRNYFMYFDFFNERSLFVEYTGERKRSMAGNIHPVQILKESLRNR